MRTFDLKEVFFLHLKNSIYLTKKFKTVLLSGFELETDSIDLSGKPCYSNLNLDFFLPAGSALAQNLLRYLHVFDRWRVLTITEVT